MNDAERLGRPIIRLVRIIYIITVQLTRGHWVVPPSVVLGSASQMLTLQLQLLFLLVPARSLYLLDEGHLGLLGHGPLVCSLLLGA